MSDDELLSFPCRIDIKVIGYRTENLRGAVLAIVGKHCGAVDDAAVSERLSSAGKYLSLTVTVVAETREQIDTVYRELSASNHVLMAL